MILELQTLRAVCVACRQNKPLGHFEAAAWQAAEPTYCDYCTVCSEALRAVWAHKLAEFFAERRAA